MKRSHIRSSDLPLRDGRVYHLDLRPEEMAKEIIIVGDPERVPFIADEFLENREVDRFMTQYAQHIRDAVRVAFMAFL